MMTLLRTIRGKNGSVNRSRKCWKSFQGLPRIPRLYLKSLKASRIP